MVGLAGHNRAVEQGGGRCQPSVSDAAEGFKLGEGAIRQFRTAILAVVGLAGHNGAVAAR